MLERIGNCRIVEEVASGGMAVVYRAVQDPLGRTVAIKALKSSAATEENVSTRFEREAKSLAMLQHENIIHVYDFHRERGALFIVMEYVQGIDLYDLLEKCGRLPYDVAAIVAMQVARALDYVHYRSIVHRDIKPANVMLSRQGGVKVMDFGIARDTNFGDLTEAGTGIGTPAYMSPEQTVSSKRVDFRTDLWSLAVVAYHALTGARPFEAESVGALVPVLDRARFDPPSFYVRSLPPAADVTEPPEQFTSRPSVDFLSQDPTIDPDDESLARSALDRGFGLLRRSGGGEGEGDHKGDEKTTNHDSPPEDVGARTLLKRECSRFGDRSFFFTTSVTCGPASRSSECIVRGTQNTSFDRYRRNRKGPTFSPVRLSTRDGPRARPWP